LNSIHLVMPRRQEFRQAREKLLQGCGQATVDPATRHPLPAAPQDTFAGLEKPGRHAPAASGFVLIEGDRVHRLKLGLNTVGRLPDNDVVLEDPCVSRRHCAVVVHANQRCEVQDFASKNGTLLNGQRIAVPTLFSPGDQIKMCEVALTLAHADDIGRHAPTSSQTGLL
jgi:pSer/pThr/pTyr-binding forkhead associated (FHA) protein